MRRAFLGAGQPALRVGCWGVAEPLGGGELWVERWGRMVTGNSAFAAWGMSSGPPLSDAKCCFFVHQCRIESRRQSLG